MKGRGSRRAGLAELEAGRAVAQLRARGGQFAPTGPSRVAKISTTMREDDAKRVVGQYGLRGSLPRGLPREERMRAYEGRYVAAGGPRAERWKRRAKAGEVATTASILGAGGAAAAELTARSERGRKALRRAGLNPAKVSRRAAGIGLGTVITGAGGEVLRRSAEHRRAKYTSSPAGVAASALRRMRDYTPED